MMYGFCCRWWPLRIGAPVGRCGNCHAKPKVDPEFTEDDYKAWKAAR